MHVCIDISACLWVIWQIKARGVERQVQVLVLPKCTTLFQCTSSVAWAWGQGHRSTRDDDARSGRSRSRTRPARPRSLRFVSFPVSCTCCTGLTLARPGPVLHARSPPVITFLFHDVKLSLRAFLFKDCNAHRKLVGLNPITFFVMFFYFWATDRSTVYSLSKSGKPGIYIKGICLDLGGNK
jgi:hypothetical protein